MHQLWLALQIITISSFAFENHLISSQDGVEFLTKIERVIDVFQVNLDLLVKQTYQTLMPSRIDKTQILSRNLYNTIHLISGHIKSFSDIHQNLFNHQLGLFILYVSTGEKGSVYPLIIKPMTPWITELKELSIKSYKEAEITIICLNKLKEKVSNYELEVINKKEQLINEVQDNKPLDPQESDFNESIFQMDEDFFVS